MPRPMHGKVPEKAKNFKQSIIRLFNSLSSFKLLVIFSLTLALISAILALIAPDKLSTLTDTISQGLKPNIDEKIIAEIMLDSEISEEDKIIFQGLLASNTENQEELILKIGDGRYTSYIINNNK